MSQPSAIPPDSAPRFSPLAQAIAPSKGAKLAQALLLVAICFAIYAPCLHGDFIWDDELLISQSGAIKYDNGLKKIWLSTSTPDYWPLTNTSFWLEWRLWGSHTTGYHAANILLQAMACILLWRILARLNIPGAYMAAILFAVHPVNVESVAWIAQRKNCLALVFCLLSIASYLEFGILGSRRHYWLSLGAFLLAMLSKGSVAMLPALLLILLWWRRGLRREDFARLLPFVAISLVLTVVNISFQMKGNSEPIRDADFLQRLLGAAGVVWFYLEKALLPIHLMFVYPIDVVDPSNWIWWLALLALIGVTLGLWSIRNGVLRPLFASWLFFVVALMPVMGFTDVYYMKFSLVADHYQQIALLAVVALVAALWKTWLLRARSLGMAATSIVAAAVVLLALGTITWSRSAIFENATMLYEASLRANPGSQLLHINLGGCYELAGDIENAAIQYQQAQRLKSDFLSEMYLGRTLRELGRNEEGLAHLKESVRLNDHDPIALATLGAALSSTGEREAGKALIARALAINPHSVEAINQMAAMLIEEGSFKEAQALLDKATSLAPDHAETYNTRGLLAFAQGDFKQAKLCFEESIRLNPRSPVVLCNLGAALGSLGDMRAAEEQFEKALRIRPGFASGHNNLGNALMRRGEMAPAETQLRLAIQLDPGYVDARFNLGLLLMTTDHPAEALVEFGEVTRLRPDYIDGWSKQARAAAASGNLAEALEYAEHALALAESKSPAIETQPLSDFAAKLRAALQQNDTAPAPNR